MGHSDKLSLFRATLTTFFTRPEVPERTSGGELGKTDETLNVYNCTRLKDSSRRAQKLLNRSPKGLSIPTYRLESNF